MLAMDASPAHDFGAKAAGIFQGAGDPAEAFRGEERPAAGGQQQESGEVVKLLQELIEAVKALRQPSQHAAPMSPNEDRQVINIPQSKNLPPIRGRRQ